MGGSLVDSRRERRDHRRRSSSSGDLNVLDVTTPASTEKHATRSESSATRSESRRRRRSSSGSSITAKAEGEESEVTYHIGAEPSRPARHRRRVYYHEQENDRPAMQLHPHTGVALPEAWGERRSSSEHLSLSSPRSGSPRSRGSSPREVRV